MVEADMAALGQTAQTFRLFVEFAAVAALFATPAFAHALLVEAVIEDDRVLVEAAYDTGEAAPEALIRVLDEDGELLHRLNADAEGRAEFPLEGDTAGFTVEAHDAEGHTAYRIVTPQDLAGE